ncbi:MAG TPA: hypothetical protein VF681_14045 [Abditibacteriaceae bacterium]|jgi:hypothetical protein
MDKGLIPVLAVALITWGGVLFYLMRVQSMLKGVERDVAALGDIDNSTS